MRSRKPDQKPLLLLNSAIIFYISHMAADVKSESFYPCKIIYVFFTLHMFQKELHSNGGKIYFLIVWMLIFLPLHRLR